MLPSVFAPLLAFGGAVAIFVVVLLKDDALFVCQALVELYKISGNCKGVIGISPAVGFAVPFGAAIT